MSNGIVLSSLSALVFFIGFILFLESHSIALYFVFGGAIGTMIGLILLDQ